MIVDEIDKLPLPLALHVSSPATVAVDAARDRAHRKRHIGWPPVHFEGRNPAG